jgi:hypothetical protein
MKWKRVLFSGRLLILSLLAFLLSSCHSYKNLTVKKAITRDFLLSLEPGRRYAFELKNGEKRYIDITIVANETVIGFIHQRRAKRRSNTIMYTSSFADIEREVAKISIWKVNPFTTTVTCIAAAYATLYIVATIGLSEGWWGIDF